jgi:glycosyltransferase involved in cell wall biosynthesis
MDAGRGNNPPRVSAIINFLNEERFLQEAIDSVFAQSFGDWELLLVDDGSTDGSTGIARRHAEMNPEKVKYLEHEAHWNRGMSASRNLGVREARGDYIAYLDGDDVWMPDKLEKQVAILEAHPEAAMVCGPLMEWHSWNTNAEDTGRDRIYGAGPTGRHPFADTVVDPPTLLSLFLRDDRFIPAAALMRRHAIEGVGGAEEEFRDSYQDAVFFVKLCRTEKVVVSTAIGYKYRKHPNSYTTREVQSGQDGINRMKYLDWIEKYFIRENYRDKKVWRELRRSRFLARHPALQLDWDAGYIAFRLKLLAREMVSERMYESMRATVAKCRKRSPSRETL